MSEFGSPKKETSSSLHRKNNKPLMEKRRRARINSCLIQLKGLVLEALKKDTSRFSKLEKADILEMTVKHLRSMQRQQMTVAMTTDSSVLSKYRAGYNECANEVSRYLGTIDGLDTDVRARLLCHLSNCMSSVNATTPQAQMYQATPQQVCAQQFQQIQLQIPSSTSTVALPGASSQTLNCVDNNSVNGFQTLFSANNAKLSGALQLMPATLPTGGVAFVVPAQAVQNFTAQSFSNVNSRLVQRSCPTTTTNFAFSPMHCSTPVCSPSSSTSSHDSGLLSPASSMGSSSAPTPSPKLDLNQNNIAAPPAGQVFPKEEPMWRPW